MTGRLIGVCGVKRAGKDETAKAIMESNSSFVRVAFADPMKQMALAMNPIIAVSAREADALGERFYNTFCELCFDITSQHYFVRLKPIVEVFGWDAAKNVVDVRQFLQRLGTEGGRNILGEDVWVDRSFEREVIPALNSGQSVVVTDMRFANEIRRVRESGGQVWRVDRPSLPVDTSDTGKHASEVEWRKAKPDVVITNDGTLEELAVQVRAAL